MGETWQYDCVQDETGILRYLSLHERTSPLGKVCCSVNGDVSSFDLAEVGHDEQPLIPVKDWEPCSLRDKIWWNLDEEDQNGENFCWGYSATQAHMLRRECLGLPRIYLSASGLCGFLTGGQNRGGGLDEALAGLMAVGQVTTAVVPNNSYSPRSFPKDFQVQAKQHRVLKGYDCLDSSVFEKLASGLLLGRPGAFGMRWGNGAHALCAMGLAYVSGTWKLDILGSWGSKAHDGDGTLKLAKNQMPGLSQFGGYVLGDCSMENDEALPPGPR